MEGAYLWRREAARWSLLPALLAFGAVLTIIIAVDPNPRLYGSAIWIMSVSMALAVAALTDAVFRAAIQPVYITALLYLVAYYIGPGLVHLHMARFPFYNLYYPEAIALSASLVVLVFVLCIISVNCFRLKRFSVEEYSVRKMRFPVVLGGLLAASVSSALIIGLGYFSTRRGDAQLVVEDVTPLQLVFGAIARMGSFIALSLSISFARRWRTIRAKAIIALSFAWFLVVNNPIALPRYVVGAYLITIYFVHVKQSTFTKMMFVATMLIAQLSVFPVLSEWTRGSGAELALPNPITYISEHGDFDGFQSTMNVVQWVDGAGLHHGTQLVSAVLFFVPRAFMPWKSRGTGGDAAEFVGYPFTNISAPMPAELYVDFGYGGLILFTIGLGMLIRRLDSYYWSHLDERDGLLKLTPAIAAGYVMIIFRGSLIGVLGPFVLSSILSIMAVRLVLRSKTPQRQSGGGLAYQPPQISDRGGLDMDLGGEISQRP